VIEWDGPKASQASNENMEIDKPDNQD